MIKKKLSSCEPDVIETLLSVVPDKLLREPIRNNPKAFLSISNGFRLSSIPAEKIRSRYRELILENNNTVETWAETAVNVFFDNYFSDIMELIKAGRPFGIIRFIDVMVNNENLWELDFASVLDFYMLTDAVKENEIKAAEKIKSNVIAKYGDLSDQYTNQMIVPLEKRLDTETKNLNKRINEIKELKIRLEASKNQVGHLEKEIKRVDDEKTAAVHKYQILRERLVKDETSESEKQRIIEDKSNEIVRLKRELSDSDDAFDKLEKENLYLRNNSIVADSSVKLCKEAINLLRTETMTKSQVRGFADEELDDSDTLMEAWDKLSQLEKKRMIKTVSAMDINNVSRAEIGYLEAIEGDLEIMKLLVKNLKVVLVRYMEEEG